MSEQSPEPSKETASGRRTRISERLKAAVDPVNARSILGTRLVAVGLALSCLAGGIDYFQNADAVVLTKVDLAEAVDFNHEAARANLRQASPKAQLFETSAKTGSGMEAWCDYLAGLRG